MSSIELNGSPYRTRPEFLRARFEQQLPGPYYGNRKRLKDDIVTRSPKEWRPAVVEAKFDPSLRGFRGRRGLRGLGDDDPATLGLLKDKIRPLLKKTADGLENEVLGLKGTLDQILKYQPNAQLEVQYPHLLAAWKDLGNLYGNTAEAIQTVDRLIAQAPSQGWSREDVDLFNNIKTNYEKAVNSMSAQEKKDAGLGAIPLIIIAVGIGLAAIIAVWRFTSKPRTYTEIASDKAAAYKEIESDPNLSPAQKAAIKKSLDNANPDAPSSFWSTLGWIAGIGVALWAVKIFFVDTGVVGSVGRGIGGRIALGGGSKKEESASERALERARYYGAEVEAKKSEMALARLSGPKTPRSRPSSSRPARKHRSGGGKKTQSLMFPPGFTP